MLKPLKSAYSVCFESISMGIAHFSVITFYPACGPKAMRYVHAAACRDLSTRASSDSPSLSARQICQHHAPLHPLYTPIVKSFERLLDPREARPFQLLADAVATLVFLPPLHSPDPVFHLRFAYVDHHPVMNNPARRLPCCQKHDLTPAYYPGSFLLGITDLLPNANLV